MGLEISVFFFVKNDLSEARSGIISFNFEQPSPGYEF